MHWVLVVRTWIRVTVFEQVVSVEWGRSWIGEIPCVLRARASSLWQSVITWGCTRPHTPECVQCAQPRHRQSRQRISHGISGIILQCWLRDCFCVIWQSQLTAGEGTHLWAVRILGQPCLILLPPHLHWGFLLQISSTSFYSQWYAGSRCSIFPHPPLAMLAISACSAPSWAVQVSPRAACAVPGEGERGWRCLPVLSMCSWCGIFQLPTCSGMWNTQRCGSAEHRHIRQFLYPPASPAVTLALLPSGLPTPLALPGASATNVLTSDLWVKGYILQVALCVRPC